MPRGRPPVCPNCGSNQSQKKGVRKTKTMGARRVRLCKNCGRKFTPKNQKPAEVREVHTATAKNETAAVLEHEDSVILSNEQPEVVEAHLPG